MSTHRGRPMPKEAARLKALLKRVLKTQSRKSPLPGQFPSAVEMLREDRNR